MPISPSSSTGSGGGTVPNFTDSETPSGAIPGSTFTLGHSPNPPASLVLMRNGVVMKNGGVDYTLSGNTITYTVAMATGDTHAAWYRY
jgi:hypothetical protein